MRQLAWVAAIAITIDALLGVGLELYWTLTAESGFDWDLYEQLSSFSVMASLLMAGITAAFFIYFASRMKRDAPRAGSLRFLLLTGAALFALDLVVNIMHMLKLSSWTMDGESVAADEAWKPLLFSILNVALGLRYLVIGALALMLALSARGLTRIIGTLAFLVSLVAAAVVVGNNVLSIMQQTGSPAPESITGPIVLIFDIASWSIYLFWLLFAALLASIAAGIRNA